MGRRISVPACLLFNESPSYDWVVEAVHQGFGMVMFADEEASYDSLVETTKKVCRIAHTASAASHRRWAAVVWSDVNVKACRLPSAASSPRRSARNPSAKLKSIDGARSFRCRQSAIQRRILAY